MSEVNNEDELEKIIHQTFHDLANKYGIDVDTIASIIQDYDNIVSLQIQGKWVIAQN